MSAPAYLTNKTLRRAILDGDTVTLWHACALLAERIARTYKRDREDLVSSATLKLFAVASSGKLDLGKNVFSYLTSVAMNECNRGVGQARKHSLVSLDRHLGERRDD